MIKVAYRINKSMLLRKPDVILNDLVYQKKKIIIIIRGLFSTLQFSICYYCLNEHTIELVFPL